MTPPNNPTSLSAVIPQEREQERAAQPNAAFAKSLVMPLILVAFASYLLWGIVTMRVPAGVVFPGPRFFPLIIMGGLYLLGVLLTLSALRERAAARALLERAVESEAESDAAAVAVAGMDWRSLAWIVGSFVGFAFTLQWLGWIIAAALLFWCITRAFGATRPLFNLVVGLTASSIAYIVFDMALGLPLPSGILAWGF